MGYEYHCSRIQLTQNKIFMNTKFPLLIIGLIALVIASACTERSSGNNDDHPIRCIPMRPDTAFSALDSATASTWIANYQKSDIKAVQYFTASSTDLWESMGLRKPKDCSHFPNVRIYMAKDSSSKLHLLFTPADKNGKAHWFRGKFSRSGRSVKGDGLSKLEVSEGPYIMDFTSPCPTLCQ